MICEDWRPVPAALLQPLYAAEQDRWLRRLGWDQSSSWDTIESARCDGLLPGRVVRDEPGGVVGWTFFLVEDGTFQIGGVAGRSPDVVDRLVEAALDSPEAGRAVRHAGFLYPESVAVERVFARHGFAPHRFFYLSRDLANADTVPPGVSPRRWRASDATAVAQLLKRAYDGSSSAVCFAPTGLASEWERYGHRLLATRACGCFMPGASWVAGGETDALVSGAVVTTSLGSGTAHIAQIAVDPDEHRRGVGARLLAEACQAARRSGYRRMTLLVAEENQAARRLYDRFGFTPTAEFLFAWRPARFDATSVGQGSSLATQA
jgi:ribosomal protein S18 acetylase RimI-like enzyme